jgi:hypothetical protein
MTRVGINSLLRQRVPSIGRTGVSLVIATAVYGPLTSTRLIKAYAVGGRTRAVSQPEPHSEKFASN